MTNPRQPIRLLISLLISLVLGAVSAQMQPQTPQQPAGQAAPVSPIVGMWQTSFSLGQGVPPGVGMVLYNNNGQYREEIYIEGQFVAYWEGWYSLAADGTLTHQETSKSQQLCVKGNCQALGAPETFAKLAQFQGPNSWTERAANGHVLTYQRVNSQQPVQPGNVQPGAVQPGNVQPGAGYAQPSYATPNYGAPNYATPGYAAPVSPDPTGGYPSDGYSSDDYLGDGNLSFGESNHSMIWDESPHVDPNSGETYWLPDSPDPDYSYTSPSGNDLNYNSDTDTWTETDSSGWETEVEDGDY